MMIGWWVAAWALIVLALCEWINYAAQGRSKITVRWSAKKIASEVGHRVRKDNVVVLGTDGLGGQTAYRVIKTDGDTVWVQEIHQSGDA